MSNACFSVVDACAIRIAQLSTAGAPSTGANKGFISDAQIKVDIGLELDTGAEFIQKNGCGNICAIVKEPDKIKRSTITMDLCKFDFEMMSLLCDGTLFSSAGHGVGYEPPSVSAGDPDPVCFEVWCKAWDSAAQAIPTFTTPNAAYIHFVVPFAKFTQNPFTLANGITTFTVKGDGSENTAITANGPWNDWPSVIAGGGGITHVYGVFLDATLPTATCGFQTVPSGS